MMILQASFAFIVYILLGVASAAAFFDTFDLWYKDYSEILLTLIVLLWPLFLIVAILWAVAVLVCVVFNYRLFLKLFKKDC